MLQKVIFITDKKFKEFGQFFLTKKTTLGEKKKKFLLALLPLFFRKFILKYKLINTKSVQRYKIIQIWDLLKLSRAWAKSGG